MVERRLKKATNDFAEYGKTNITPLSVVYHIRSKTSLQFTKRTEQLGIWMGVFR